MHASSAYTCWSWRRVVTPYSPWRHSNCLVCSKNNIRSCFVYFQWCMMFCNKYYVLQYWCCPKIRVLTPIWLTENKRGCCILQHGLLSLNVNRVLRIWVAVYQDGLFPHVMSWTVRYIIFGYSVPGAGYVVDSPLYYLWIQCPRRRLCCGQSVILSLATVSQAQVMLWTVRYIIFPGAGCVVDSPLYYLWLQL